MKTKKSIVPPDFQYAEFSGDVFCPFCNVLLSAKPLGQLPAEDEEADDNPDGGGLCQHVGFWSYGNQGHPNVNENWRKEMFMLTRAIKNQQYDGEAGYYWQDALLSAIGDEGDGCIGRSAANVIPNFQVAFYRQFSYEPETPGQRYLGYVAIILRKRPPPEVPVVAAIADGPDDE